MPETPDPLTFTLADFERVLGLWDCKVTDPVVYPDGPPGLMNYPLVKRSVFAPSGHRMTINYKEKAVQDFCKEAGDDADNQIVAAALHSVRSELNKIGFYGPSSRETLAMIRMFDALEAAYPQTDLLACDAEMPEFMDTFKWGLAAGVAVGLVLDDPEILEED